MARTLTGYIAEVIIFNSALTAGQVASVEAALQAKWGL